MKKPRSYFPIIAGLIASVSYAAISFLTPFDYQHNYYNIDPNNRWIISLSIVLPILVIWYLAISATVRFSHYASLIRGSRDGEAFHKVSDGLAILVLGVVAVPIVSAFTTVLRRLGDDGSWTIFINYLTVAYLLIAFMRMYRGSRELTALVGQPKQQYSAASVVGFIAATIIYVFAVFSNEFRNATPDIFRVTSFFLPDWLIVTTLIIPYILTWYFGIYTVLNLKQYAAKAKGALYKRSVAGLANGLLTIIGYSIFLQLLVGLGEYFRTLNLSGILAVVYVIIFLYGFGYYLVARSSKRLSKIEQVA